MNEEALDDKEIVLVLRKLSGERKEKLFFTRKSIKNYMDKLHGNMPDAMYQIGYAPNLYESPKCRTTNYDSARGVPRNDLNIWEIDVKERYEKWIEVMRLSYISFYITEQICQKETEIGKLAKQERLTNHTVEKLFIHGLNEFCIVSGWGDQTNK